MNTTACLPVYSHAEYMSKMVEVAQAKKFAAASLKPCVQCRYFTVSKHVCKTCKDKSNFTA